MSLYLNWMLVMFRFGFILEKWPLKLIKNNVLGY